MEQDISEITNEVFFSLEEDIIERKERPKIIPEHILKKREVKPLPRSDEEWSKIFEPYPSTPDGFLKAFDPTEVSEYKAALEKYGFVVIKLLDEDQCEKTVEEFFFDMNRRAGHQITPIKRYEPWTWPSCNWPEKKKKFLTNTPALTQHAFENRTNPVLYNIFCNLLNTTELWTSIDNWACFRGTKNLRWITEEGEEIITDREKWRYSLRLHWDVNPWVLQKWRDNGEPELYQGVIALVDCSDEVGSFMAVPGSHTFMEQWIKERPCPHMKCTSTRPTDDDPMQRYRQKVPLRRGELVIWYTRTAHCNFPNNSNQMRHGQYVRLMPATKSSQNKDKYASRRIMYHYRNDPFTDWSLPYLTPLGRKIVGLENWDGTPWVMPVYYKPESELESAQPDQSTTASSVNNANPSQEDDNDEIM